MTSPMIAVDTDKLFVGSIPELYDTHLVPLIFESYATDLAQRLAARRPRRVLEIAAGTGVVTRAIDVMLHDGASIVATDLNPAMLDRAAARGPGVPARAPGRLAAITDRDPGDRTALRDRRSRRRMPA